MMTTDNSKNISEDQEYQKDQEGDNGKTQAQIDREEREDLVKAEVSAPISESQVEPGREAVDGNGRRDLDDVEATRGDVIVDKDAQTQHAKEVQDKQNAKLDSRSK